MSTLAERVNNAIVKIDHVAPSEPAGTRQAITDLGTHWLTFWGSSERRLLPPLALHAKLLRYAKWYTRAYALVPATTQAKLPHPATLDATVWAAWEDQIKHMATGNEAAAAFTAQNLEKLKTELEKGTGALVKAVVVLGGVATAVMLAYAFAKIAR